MWCVGWSLWVFFSKNKNLISDNGNTKNSSSYLLPEDANLKTQHALVYQINYKNNEKKS